MALKLLIKRWPGLKEVLPTIPFSRVNDLCTDPREFIVAEKVYKNPLLIWFGIPYEVCSSEIIIGAEDNGLNGWHGYVHKEGWIGTGEDKTLQKRLAKAIS